MAGGFTSPSILFLSTWDLPERSFCAEVFKTLAKEGKYKHYVEPCAGGFAMPLVAANSGFKPDQMACSDTSLFSSIVGTMLDHGEFERLDVRYEGQPVEIEGDTPVERAAHLLWVQLKARMEARPDVEYWRQMQRDVRNRKVQHRNSMGKRLQSYMDRLGGSKYEARDMWSHIESVMDDPETVISINPPTYCVEVSERVLTEDLRWIAAGEVRVGDRLIGVDESTVSPDRRRFRPSVVTRSVTETVPCVRVTLSDGTSVVTTPDHPWLARSGPGAVRSWRRSDRLLGKQVFRMFDVWDEDRTREGGWLAGMYDGEGHLNQRSGKKASTQLVMSQKRGPLMEQFEQAMLDREFKVAVRDGENCAQATISQTAEVARALGSLRPSRLLGKYLVDRPARAIDTPTVVSVESVGMREIQSMTTSTATYIASGFAMHNTGGFERFFDTKGRLTWAEPDYEVFDPMIGIPRLVEMMEGKAALLMCQQQREPGQSAHKRPVFGRHLSIGQYVYLNSNRPDEIFEITGGFKVAPMKAIDLTPMNLPILPVAHEIREDSKVVVVPIKAGVADYYRGLWMHRLKAEPGTMNLLMVVDGYAAGVIGYNTAAMTNPYHADTKWARHAILRFAFGAPHDALRITRLATMVALRRETIEILLTPSNAIHLSASEGLVTVEYTRHPEAKGLRGLMKRVDRTPHPDGFRLIYAADWSTASLEDTVKQFVTKETTWQKQRSTSV